MLLRGERGGVVPSFVYNGEDRSNAPVGLAVNRRHSEHQHFKKGQKFVTGGAQKSDSVGFVIATGMDTI